jgi:hypothetical protein
LVQVFYFQIPQIPVYIYDDGYADRRFTRRYGNGEEGEEKALQLPRV